MRSSSNEYERQKMAASVVEVVRVATSPWVGWRFETGRSSESTAASAVHAFNIPVSEAKGGAGDSRHLTTS
ncbi:hypothetical protein GCM10011585_20390 [Edaphobacter dinghuensis]|uniref:Uncharacterized protein n=1 Tax=Edaphobacter dinghuensis TaxID=1560005 RepID=A0A917HF35_9BACT|nr:hypothetical protein GCM10011585_20390 [Edaphobacter dinghuensis]